MAGGSDHGEGVAPEAAQVRPDDRHRGARRHGGIGGRAPVCENADPRAGGQLVGRRDHAAPPAPGPEGCEGEAHTTTTERSTSPRCIRANAASTSPIPIVSLTKRSRSRRPSR